MKMSENRAADPSHMLIENEYLPARHKTSLPLFEKACDVGNVMKDIQHADDAQALIGKWELRCIDQTIDSLIRNQIGRDDVGNNLLYKTAARTEFQRATLGRTPVHAFPILAVDFQIEKSKTRFLGNRPTNLRNTVGIIERRIDQFHSGTFNTMPAFPS